MKQHVHVNSWLNFGWKLWVSISEKNVNNEIIHHIFVWQRYHGKAKLLNILIFGSNIRLEGVPYSSCSKRFWKKSQGNMHDVVMF